MCSTATNVAKIIKVISIYKPYIIYKEKSASCQHDTDKMLIYIYQRFYSSNAVNTTLLPRNTFHRNKSHKWKVQPTTIYIIMGIAGVLRPKRFYSSINYFVALVSGASPMRSIN